MKNTLNHPIYCLMGCWPLINDFLSSLRQIEFQSPDDSFSNPNTPFDCLNNLSQLAMDCDDGQMAMDSDHQQLWYGILEKKEMLVLWWIGYNKARKSGDYGWW